MNIQIDINTITILLGSLNKTQSYKLINTNTYTIHSQNESTK